MELLQRQQIRRVLLSALLNMTQYPSSAAMTTALTASLSAQTIRPDELSSDSSSTSILSIANNLFSYGMQLNVDHRDISHHILTALDAIAGQHNTSIHQLTETLQNYVLFASSQLYPSQESVENVFWNFKTSVNGLSSSSIAVPVSSLELLADTRTSTVDVSQLLPGDFSSVHATLVGLVELQSSLFSKKENSSSFLSNPLLITLATVRFRNQSIIRNMFSKFIFNFIQKYSNSS
jgi:hypothetical protein